MPAAGERCADDEANVCSPSMVRSLLAFLALLSCTTLALAQQDAVSAEYGLLAVEVVDDYLGACQEAGLIQRK